MRLSLCEVYVLLEIPSFQVVFKSAHNRSYVSAILTSSLLLLLQKESWVHISDNTNIRWVRIFHLYKGFHRKVTVPGFFVKGSARVVEPPRIEYKGFKYKYSLKGDICRLFYVRSRGMKNYLDGSVIRFDSNSAICIKKKQDPKSKYLNGPISRRILRRRFLVLFKYVI